MQKDNPAQIQSESLLYELFGATTPIVKIYPNQEVVSTDLQSGWHCIHVVNKATPRPRGRAMSIGGGKITARIYNPTDYTKWKLSLSERIRHSGIVTDSYNTVDVIFGIPLKKSYTKKNKALLEGKLHDKKPDFDNYLKGILDAVQQSGKIKDDSLFGSGMVEKIWIAEDENEFILINLIKTQKTRFNYKNILNKSKIIR